MQNFSNKLNQLDDIMQKPSFRQNKGLGNEVGYYIFDYPASCELQVRAKINDMLEKNQNSSDDFKIIIFDIYNIVIDILKSKGYLNKCFEFEASKGLDRVIKSVSSVLKITAADSLIVEHIKSSTPKKAVVFITGIGKCYPLVRAHTVLNNLHQVMDHVPVVLFYPGNYDGLELVLFGEIKDDNYYRAFKLVN